MAQRKKAPKKAPRIDVSKAASDSASRYQRVADRAIVSGDSAKAQTALDAVDKAKARGDNPKEKSVRSDGTETTKSRRRVGTAQGRREVNPATGLKEGGVPVTAEDIRDDFEAQTVSAEHNARYAKLQNAEIANTSEITQARRNQLTKQSAQLGNRNDNGSLAEAPVGPTRSSITPGVTPKLVGRRTNAGGTKRRGRAMGPLISVDAEKAAGPATIPASGTAPGSGPAGLPDDRDGRTVTIRPGLGAPEAGAPANGRRVMRSLQDRITVRSRARNRTSSTGRAVSTENFGSLPEKTTTDKTQKSFRSAPAGGKAAQRRKKYATVARNADVVTEAARLRKNNPTPGKWGTDKAVTQALEDNHITYEQAAELSPKYMADLKSVPSVDSYVGSDKAMAHELASTHLKGVTAGHIMSYASANNITVQSLHKEVKNNATGQGKLTNWVMNPKTGSREPFHWRKSGSKRISGRDASGANITKTAQHPTSAPEGSLSHIDYIKNQIQKHVENTKLDSADSRRSKGRGRSESTKTAMFVQSQLTNNKDVEGVEQTNILPGGDSTVQTKLVNKVSKRAVTTPSGAEAVTPPKLVSPVDNTVDSAATSLYPNGKSGAMLVDTTGPDDRGLRTSDGIIEKAKKGFTEVPKPKNTMR